MGKNYLGFDAFLSMTLSFSKKKMVIYVEIHKIISVIELIKTVVSLFNSKVNNLIFTMNLLHFACLFKI